MEALVHTISHRIAAYLEKAGLIQRDMDNTLLDLPMDDEEGTCRLIAYPLCNGCHSIILAPQEVFRHRNAPSKIYYIGL